MLVPWNAEHILHYVSEFSLRGSSLFSPVVHTGNMQGLKYISGYAAMTAHKNCGHSSINSDVGSSSD